MNAPANLIVASGRIAIAACVMYGIFKYGRTLEPIVRRVRWAIVLTGILGYCILLKFFPSAPLYVEISIIIPTVFFFFLPDMAVQLVRAVRAIARHFGADEFRT